MNICNWWYQIHIIASNHLSNIYLQPKIHLSMFSPPHSLLAPEPLSAFALSSVESSPQACCNAWSFHSPLWNGFWPIWCSLQRCPGTAGKTFQIWARNVHLLLPTCSDLSIFHHIGFSPLLLAANLVDPVVGYPADLAAVVLCLARGLVNLIDWSTQEAEVTPGARQSDINTVVHLHIPKQRIQIQIVIPRLWST